MMPGRAGARIPWRVAALVGLLLLVGAAAFTWSGRGRVDAPPPVADRGERVARLLMATGQPADPDLLKRMAESDRVTAELREAGVDDVGGGLRRRLSSIQVSDALVEEFVRGNPGVFGNRSAAESRSSAETLIRIHVLRRELGISEPDRGLRWPSSLDGLASAGR